MGKRKRNTEGHSSLSVKQLIRLAFGLRKDALPDDGDVSELVRHCNGRVIERDGRRNPPRRRVVSEDHQLVLAPVKRLRK